MGKPDCFNYNKYMDLKERNRWVPVEERLPEPYKRYLVTIVDDDIRAVDVCMYSSLGWELEFVYRCKVVSWMNLPEPFEGGE